MQPPSSRNAPCPCNSGRRYKDCHGALALEPAPPAASPGRVGELLARALEHHQAGRLAEAEVGYREALTLAPNEFDALHMLGVVAYQRRDFDDAARLVSRAIAIRPADAAAHSNLGLALHGADRRSDALIAFQRALALRPDFVEARSNRGILLREMGRHAEALGDLEAAAAARPDSPVILSNLGNALLELARHVEAAGAFDRLCAVAPGYDWAAGYRLLARRNLADWRDHDNLVREVELAVVAGRRAIVPHAFLATSDDPARQLACARTYFDSLPRVAPLARPVRCRSDGGRIRVAYVSGDFREHPVAMLAAPLFSSHDRARFEIIGVSYGPAGSGPARQRIEGECDRFLDVRGRSDTDAARLIRELDVDIAVDLAGYTLGARPGILSHRPARVQVQWLGYPGTLADPAIDYIIADATVIAPGEERHYTEAVVRLPFSYHPLATEPADPVEPPARSTVGLPADAFVFCCFNATYKITPGAFGGWMRVLAAVPDSVLWLLEDQAEAAVNLRREAERRSVAGSRLVFAPRVQRAYHLARQQLADLGLDSHPYNAHTTAVDALSCGVPMVTTLGSAFPARVAASLLRAAGLHQLVADTQDAMEALATRLAGAPEELAAARVALAALRRAGSAVDPAFLRMQLEAAYETMMRRLERGEPPASFDVLLPP